MIDNLNDIIQNDNLLRAELDMKSVMSVIQMLNVHIKSQDNRIKLLEKQIPNFLLKEVFDREKAFVQGRCDQIENNTQENSMLIHELKQNIEKDKKEMKKFIGQQFDSCLFQIGVEKTSLNEQIQNISLQIEDLYKLSNESRIPDEIMRGFESITNQQKQITSMNKKLESMYDKYIALSKTHEEPKQEQPKQTNEILLDSMQADIDTLMTKVANLEEEVQKIFVGYNEDYPDQPDSKVLDRSTGQPISFRKKDQKKDNKESEEFSATITFDPAEVEDLKQKYESQNNLLNDCHRKLKQLITRIRVLESHQDNKESAELNRSMQASEQISAINSALELQKLQAANQIDKNEMISIISNQIRKEFDFENYQKACSDLKKANVQTLSALDRKVDRQFVERLFDKFRSIINGLNENVTTLSESISGFASVKDVEELAKIVKNQQNVTQCAAGKKTQVCLFCGRPRTSVTGQISRQQAAKLGMPPTAHIGSEGNVIYGDISLGNTQSQTFNPLPQLVASQ